MAKSLPLITFPLFLAIFASPVSGGEWVLITSPNFTLMYDRLDERIAEDVLGFAEESLGRISGSLGARPKEKLSIYLCSTEAQFKELTRAGVPDWGIGCALPRSGMIVLKSPRAVGRNLDLRVIVSHEVSHVLLGQLLGEVTPPRWFDEGLAIYESKEWRAGDGLTLAWANLSNSLIPLSEIEGSFPARERGANLAYTEGFSAVSFIVREYGEETLRELISSVGKLGGIDPAMRANLGVGYGDFERLWLDSVKKTYNLPYLLGTTPLFWGGMALLVLLVFLIKRVKGKRRLAKLDLPYPGNEEVNPPPTPPASS